MSPDGSDRGVVRAPRGASLELPRLYVAPIEDLYGVRDSEEPMGTRWKRGDPPAENLTLMPMSPMFYRGIQMRICYLLRWPFRTGGDE